MKIRVDALRQRLFNGWGARSRGCPGQVRIGDTDCLRSSCLLAVFGVGFFHPDIVHICCVRRGDRDLLVLSTFKRPAPRDALV